MAEFTPVGVRATVQGAKKFLRDIASMDIAVSQLQRNMGRGTQVQSQAAASQNKVATALQRSQAAARLTGAAQRSLTEITVKTNNVMQNYGVLLDGTGAKVQQLGQKLAFLALRNIETNNATTRFITNSRVLSETLVNLIARKTRLAATLGALKVRYDETNAALKRADAAYKNSGKQLVTLALKADKMKSAINVAGLKAEASATKHAALTQQLAEMGAKAEQTSSQYLKLKASMQSAEATTAELEDKTRALKATQEQEQQALAEVEARHNSAGAEAREHAATLSLLSVAMNKLGKAIQQVDSKIGLLGAAASVLATLKGAFEGLSRAAKKLASALSAPQRAFKAIGTQMNRAVGGANKLGVAWFKAGNSIRFYGLSWIFLISLPIIGFLGGLTSAALKFETAMAGVIKTVDGLVKEGTLSDLNEQGETLSRRFRDMALEIPIAAARLAGLGQIAGQLGVRGVDNITNFVDVTAKLGVSTDLAAEDAGRLLAQIIAITGPLTKAEAATAGMTGENFDAATASEIFGIQIQAVGSTLVGLGNQLPTTEFQIARFAQRIAAAGELVGVTQQDLFGIAAAFASVGIPAERGGTAVQKAFKRIIEATQLGGEQLRLFADITGESMEDFSQAFIDGGEGAADTFAKFIVGLGQNKDKAIPILGDLELSNERVFNTLVSLANATDTQGNANQRLIESLRIAREEFQKYGGELGSFNALQLEAARRFNTTESQLILLKNQFNDIGITVGAVLLPPIVKATEVLRAFGKRIEEFARTESGQTFIKLAIAVSIATASFGGLVVGFGLLLSTAGFVLSAITLLAAAFTFLWSTIGLLVLPITAVVAAFVGLSIAMAASVTNIGKVAKDGFGGLAKRLYKFGREMILALAKGMAKASAAIVQVLIGIGNIIRYWLKPGSPPKIAPDLDKWGAEAMTVYLKGWLEGDFGVFNAIANKLEGFIRSIGRDVGEENIVPRILGTREAIAKAINMVREVGRVTQESINTITSAMGSGTQAVSNYARALLNLQLIQDKYSKSLEPMNDRLKEISDRQEEVSRALRTAELEEILADPRSSELVRELANLELEQIDLQEEVGALEDARDLELEAAESKLAVAEATLDLQIKQNNLIEEQIALLEQAAKKLKGSLDSLGGVDPFESMAFDEDPFEEMFTGIDEAIDSAVQGISDEFGGLVLDIQAIFAPLLPMWEQLGEVWTPIFQVLGGLFEGFLGINPFADWTLPSEILDLKEGLGSDAVGRALLGGMSNEDLVEAFKLPPLLTDQHLEGVQNLSTKVQEFLDGPVYELLAVLVDLGIISPFGPLLEEWDQLAESGGTALTPFGESMNSLSARLSPILDEVSRFVEILGGALDAFSTPEGGEGGGIGGFFTGIKDAIDGVIEKVSPLVTTIMDFLKPILEIDSAVTGGVGDIFKGIPTGDVFTALGESFGMVKDSVVDMMDVMRETGMLEVIKKIGQVFAIMVSVGARFIAIGLGALLTGIARAIEFALPFLALLFQGFLLISTGVLEIIRGVIDFVGGFIEVLVGLIIGVITGNSDLLVQGLKHMSEAIGTIIGGIIRVIAGLFTQMYAIVSGIFFALVGFVLGLVEGWMNGVVGFFSRLPGGIAEQVTAVLVVIQTFVDDMIAMVQLLIDTVFAIFEWLFDALIGHSVVTDITEGIVGAFEWMIEEAEIIYTWFSDLPGRILGALATLVEDIKAVGANVISGFKDGLEENLGDPIGAIGDVASGVLGKVTGFLGIDSPSKEFVGVGENIMGGWKKGLTDGSVAVLRIMKLVSSKVLEIAIATFKILNEALRKGLTEMLKALEIFSEKAFVTRSGLWYKMLEAALEFFDDFMDTLNDDLLPDLLKLITEFLEDLLELIVSNIPLLIEAGVSMIDGLMEGLNSRAEALYNLAREIAANVSNIIDDAFENDSPSKVFFRVGENIVKGWELGMISETSNLAAAASGLAGIVSRAGASVASGRVASAGVSAPSAAAPLAALPAGAGGVSVDLGGQTINNGIDAITFQILVEQAVRKAIRV